MAQEWLAPRVQQALESVAGSSEGRTAERAKEERGGSVTDAQINPALRGVSMKLLEKVTLCSWCAIKLNCVRVCVCVGTWLQSCV